jgi:hypothetical protein
MKFTLLAAFASAVFLCNPPAIAGSTATISGAKGNYAGLLTVPDADASLRPSASAALHGHVVRGHLPNEDPLNSGTLTVLVGTSGRFTAVLNWKGYKYSFRGEFDSTTSIFELDLADRGQPGEVLALRLTLNVATRLIHSELTALGLDDPRTPEKERAFYTAEGDLSGAEPDSEAGKAFAGSLNTSFIDPPDYGTLPQDIRGDGFTVTRISKRRGYFARIAGRLPDDEPFTAGSILRGTNYTVFAGLYFKNGRFGGSTIGQLSAADRTSLQNIAFAPDLPPKVLWAKGKLEDPEYYGAGFETGYGIKTLVYLLSRLGGGKQLPQISINPGPINATLVFREGNLGEDLNGDDITVMAKIKITPFGVKVLETTGIGSPFTVPNPHHIALRTNALAATWSGSFDHPVSGIRTAFHGAFSQARRSTATEVGKNGEGRGSFRGSLPPKASGFLESGSVRMIVD